jgi:hypothetical protein
MAADPRYKASARTAQKTPIPKFILLRAPFAAIIYQRPLFTEPLPSKGYCTAAYFKVVA